MARQADHSPTIAVLGYSPQTCLFLLIAMNEWLRDSHTYAALACMLPDRRASVLASRLSGLFQQKLTGKSIP